MKRNLFYFKIQLVPRSKHAISGIKTNQLMMCRKIIAVTLRRIFKEISSTNGRWTELAQDQVQSLSLAAVALNFGTLPSELVISP
jgi:hypothetical protein